MGIILGRGRRQLASLLWKASVEEEVDAELSFHVEMRTRELNEQDCWLYVAMTRAKQTIALCWSDDRYEKNSWAQRSRLQTAERFGRGEKYQISIRECSFLESPASRMPVFGVELFFWYRGLHHRTSLRKTIHLLFIIP